MCPCNYYTDEGQNISNNSEGFLYPLHFWNWENILFLKQCVQNKNNSRDRKIGEKNSPTSYVSRSLHRLEWDLCDRCLAGEGEAGVMCSTQAQDRRFPSYSGDMEQLELFMHQWWLINRYNHLGPLFGSIYIHTPYGPKLHFHVHMQQKMQNIYFHQKTFTRMFQEQMAC